MSETIMITLVEPLPCCRQLAVQHRCSAPATTAQATRHADGSYHVQPYCWFCAVALGLTERGETKEATDAD